MLQVLTLGRLSFVSAFLILACLLASQNDLQQHLYYVLVSMAAAVSDTAIIITV